MLSLQPPHYSFLYVSSGIVGPSISTLTGQMSCMLIIGLSWLLLWTYKL